MNIQLYPSFNDVFADTELLGIFYPLCSVSNNQFTSPIHFVSSNGIWMDEAFKTKNNNSGFTIFDVIKGKYKFNGNIKLYNGYEEAKVIFPMLEHDFSKNGESYLTNKTKTNPYTEAIQNQLPLLKNENFDLEYYIKTFYEYSITKLNYKLNGKFLAFTHLIDGWAKSESPIVYENDSAGMESTISELERPEIENFESYSPVGKIIGAEFFTDGNDTVLFYNAKAERAAALNSYS